jgi:hypothetical protein
MAEVPKLEWNSLFPDPRQDWLQFGRRSLCFEVRSGGELRALVPAYVEKHRNGQDRWHWLRRLYQPQALVLGSQLEEACPLGFAADVTATEKRALLTKLLRCADDYARKNECDILVVKHADDAADELWIRACVPLRLRRLPDVSILGSSLCGRRVANTSNWYRSRVSWFRWAESLFDSVCTVDLNEDEMTSLVLKKPRNGAR